MYFKIRELIKPLSQKALHYYDVVFREKLSSVYSGNSQRETICALLKKEFSARGIDDSIALSIINDTNIGDNEWIVKFENYVLDIFIDEILIDEYT